MLSLTSNMIRKEKNSVGDLQSLAKTKIVETVSRLGWVVTWGPVVWKNDPKNQSTGPDHVWFVAKQLRHAGLPDRYAISVAGSATMYSHIIHNAGVVQVVDFEE